jgi:hypothetical protein
MNISTHVTRYNYFFQQSRTGFGQLANRILPLASFFSLMVLSLSSSFHQQTLPAAPSINTTINSPQSTSLGVSPNSSKLDQIMYHQGQNYLHPRLDPTTRKFSPKCPLNASYNALTGPQSSQYSRTDVSKANSLARINTDPKFILHHLSNG